VGPGDEVITVSHTFIATIQVIHHLGATPILVDVGGDGLMDWEEVTKKVNEKTKAVIPVHLSGDYVRPLTLNDKPVGISYNNIEIPIIEDAAQAIGAEGVGYGLAQCYSFYPAKVLGTFGDAGALATNDDVVAERVRRLRNHGGVTKDKYDTYEFGWNSRMDNVWAATLNVKLDYLSTDLKKREVIASMYSYNLSDLPIGLPVSRSGRIWQDYIIRSKTRDELNTYLNEHGIGTLGTDSLPNHLHPGLGLDHFKLPKTEKITKESIRIPCNHFMTVEEADYIINTIREFHGM
jgi:dTDP-4-amino-4,6-dideoxygalactose transaminase